MLTESFVSHPLRFLDIDIRILVTRSWVRSLKEETKYSIYRLVIELHCKVAPIVLLLEHNPYVDHALLVITVYASVRTFFLALNQLAVAGVRKCWCTNNNFSVSLLR